MSKVLIVASDSKGFVSSPRNVVVPPAGKVDKLYDNKITKVINERDRVVELTETQTFFSRDSSSQNEIQRFLQEGLDLKSTKDMSRQAKLLMNKRQGRQQSYGLVLEELMKSRGQTINLSQPGSPNKAEKGEVTAERKDGGKEGETVVIKPGSAKATKIV
ncbi:hypothetical protein EON65_00720 [archaeon]|nr:MAG: hypothetical protein EON65_00720 [archaeon]